VVLIGEIYRWNGGMDLMHDSLPDVTPAFRSILLLISCQNRNLNYSYRKTSGNQGWLPILNIPAFQAV
jgi:hypothetical protein